MKPTRDEAEEQESKGVENAVAFGLLLPVLLFYALTLQKLWLWHVVPTFGWPALSYGHAVGLMALLGVVRSSTGGEKPPLKLISMAVVRCGFALALGWCFA